MEFLSKEKMEVVDVLKSIMGDIILTGSISLKNDNLISREVGDIDVIVTDFHRYKKDILKIGEKYRESSYYFNKKDDFMVSELVKPLDKINDIMKMDTYYDMNRSSININGINVCFFHFNKINTIMYNTTPSGYKIANPSYTIKCKELIVIKLLKFENKNDFVYPSLLSHQLIKTGQALLLFYLYQKMFYFQARHKRDMRPSDY